MEEQKLAKVTLYLPPDLHRQLKIRSAVEGEAMSSIAKRALDFYLAHSEVVDEGSVTGLGQTHRIYSCPSCTTPLALRQGDLVEVARLSPRETGDELGSGSVSGMVLESGQLDEGELLVCG